MNYDKIILGAGLYGLYSALFCGRRGEKVAVFEYDDAPFRRATYINQARVHMGYHYPRSFSTAIKSAGYFRRFNEEYGFCVHRSFDQIYATSAAFSCTDAAQFEKFCRAAGIRCEEVAVSKYFNSGMCDGAFLTEEYTYDAMILKKYSTLNIGMALFLVDFGITVAASLVFDIETGLFSFCGLMAKSLVIDGVIENINLCKYFTIVCENPEPICTFIQNELKRGATIYHAEGAYAHKEKTIILTVMKRSQAVQLRNFIHKTEPGAFIAITNSSEIIGKGFRGLN